MPEPTFSRKTYLAVFVALLVLTYLTYSISQVDLGAFNITAALSIAVIKALLVALYFMHLRFSPWLEWVVFGGGLYWLGILIALTMSDYLTRGWPR